MLAGAGAETVGAGSGGADPHPRAAKVGATIKRKAKTRRCLAIMMLLEDFGAGVIARCGRMARECEGCHRARGPGDPGETSARRVRLGPGPGLSGVEAWPARLRTHRS